MTYKARRTRDLQGEVKAGTGMSVTESVNPDGTKVYTLENTAPGGGNEFDEIKIVDGENVKVLIDTDGVHLFNEDGSDVGVWVHDEIILRDEEGDDRVVINRNGRISLINDEGNETFWFDYEDGTFYLRNKLGNDKFIVEEDGNLTDLRLCDEDGNEVLSGISLIDMQNSLWSFAPDMQFFDIDNPKSFGLKASENILATFCEPNNVRDNNYYEIEDTEYTNILGYSPLGILLRYSGTYEVTIDVWAESGGSNGHIYQRVDIVKNHTLLEYRASALALGRVGGNEINGGRVLTKHIITTNNDNTFIVPYWYYQYAEVDYGSNIADGEYTTITIQKIR